MTRVKTLSIYLPYDLKSPSEIVSKVTSLLISSLPLLPNITCFRIELTRESSAFFATLLQIITSFSLPRTLQKLRIYGHVDMFTSLGEYSAHTTPFRNLTELDLSLGYREHLGFFKEPPIQPNLSLTLVPFLQSFAPTLRLLRVSNWSETLDLFTHFNALNQFDSSVPVPNLKSLFLYLPGVSVSSPRSSFQSLRRFLLTHSNGLQLLHLTITRPHLNPGVDKLLGAWLAELVNNNIQFPCIQTLQLYPSISQIGLSALLALIKRTSSTLYSLTIPNRYLTGEEVGQLLDALTEGEVQVPTTSMVITTPRTSKLRVLSISINHLSVPFLELLAHKLPQLERLSLRVSEIVDSPVNALLSSIQIVSTEQKYPPSSIHSTTFSTSDGTIGVIQTISLPPKTYSTRGSCATSRSGGGVSGPMLRVRWRVPYLL